MPNLLDFIGTLAQQSVPLVSGAMRGRQARQQQDRQDADEAAEQQATMRRYLLQQAQLDEDRRHNRVVEDAALTRQTTPSAYGGRSREDYMADLEEAASIRERHRATRKAAGSGEGRGTGGGRTSHSGGDAHDAESKAREMAASHAEPESIDQYLAIEYGHLPLATRNRIVAATSRRRSASGGASPAGPRRNTSGPKPPHPPSR